MHEAGEGGGEIIGTIVDKGIEDTGGSLLREDVVVCDGSRDQGAGAVS